MDKNSLIGLLLIGGLLVFWSVFMSPDKTKLEQQKPIEKIIDTQTEDTTINNGDTVQTKKIVVEQFQDSLQNIKNETKFGQFYNASKGENKIFELESDVLKIFVSNKGGLPVKVELKKYKTYQKTKLYLFEEKSTILALALKDAGFSLSDLYFKSQSQVLSTNSGKNDSLQFSLRAYNNTNSGFIEFIYKLKNGNYLVDFDFRLENINISTKELALLWDMKSISKEKGIKQERAKSSAYWKNTGEKVDYIGEGKHSKEEEFEFNLDWIGFKQQFFSVVLIAENQFKRENTVIETKSTEETNEYVEQMLATSTVPIIDNKSNFKFFFGPNKYNLLEGYSYDLHRILNLGWGIIGWANKWIVIPIFDILEKFNLNYGIIILILTIFIKLCLSPVTYKTYISSAKQKALKPEISAINEKYKNSDATKKQKEIMNLYKQAGVNPLSGCIPMLVQMPILYAMFQFFPTSIEIRQKSFLWAEDLSTYDSVFSWTENIPVLSSFYGNHISLFTLLMAISTFLYTKYNASMTSGIQGAQAQQMKVMTYMMPGILLIFFNSFPAGLSLYYLMSNIITMLQQFVIKKYIIDEEKLHNKIQENMKNPSKSKNRFQRKMDQIMEQQKNMKKK